MLTWRYEQPHFYGSNKKGNCIILGFGHEYLDDIEISGEMFFLYLRKHEAQWQVELDKNMSRWWANKEMVDRLIHEINDALTKKEDYDISAYAVSHKSPGSYFHFGVRQEENK